VRLNEGVSKTNYAKRKYNGAVAPTEQREITPSNERHNNEAVDSNGVTYCTICGRHHDDGMYE
jgi:hypothetical protein